MNILHQSVVHLITRRNGTLLLRLGGDEKNTLAVWGVCFSLVRVCRRTNYDIYNAILYVTS